MIDTRLIDALKVMVDKERKIKEYKRRIRIKGIVTAKGTTKNKNITLTVEKGEDNYKYTVLKSHKERFALAGKLRKGSSISIEGIPKFRVIICTRLKLLEKGLARGKQEKLAFYAQEAST